VLLLMVVNVIVFYLPSHYVFRRLFKAAGRHSVIDNTNRGH
jgi:hypothetical protein